MRAVGEPKSPRPPVERYVIMIDPHGEERPADRFRYAGASTAREAGEIAHLAALEHGPPARVWTRVVGDGRTRLARAAARERYPDHDIRATAITESPELTHFEVRARARIAGGWRETLINLWVDELGRVRWPGEGSST